MKRSTLFIIPIFVLVAALTGAAIQTTEVCDQKALKENAKAGLDPYKYDSGKLTRINYKKKEALKEIEVPVFIGEKYRFVFNSEGITRPLVVSVYNKDKEAKNRKELFTFTASPSGPKIHSYEPDGAKTKYYIDYTIPAVNDSMPAPECMVFMLGFK
jgi:hypothetical protein